MRNLKYLSFGIIGLIFASCVDEKNLYSPNEEEPEETKSGLVADFLLKMKKSISVTAVNGDGKVQKGVKIGIFASQPYGAEGRMVAEPAGVGYTDASGRLNTDVVIAE